MTTQTELLREALEAIADLAFETLKKPPSEYYWGLKEIMAKALTQPEQPAPQMADPIPANISADLERSDWWTPEEALRWYAAGKHYDTVGGRARILDNGPVASNALKAMSLESPTPPQAEQAEAAKPKNVPFQLGTWELDADGFAPALCTECGTPVRYGSRHSKCGQKLMEAEAAKPANALDQARPVTYGGCPFCGRQDCVAGSCMHTTKPATLSEFIRSDDSTRDAIVARVVEAAVEMQRAVMAKPETGREPRFQNTYCSSCGGEFGPGDHGYSHCEDHSASDSSALVDKVSDAMVDADLPPSWCLENAKKLQRFAAALLSADSKDAGEPAGWQTRSRYCPEWANCTKAHYDEFRLGRSSHGVEVRCVYTRPQAADAQPLKTYADAVAWVERRLDDFIAEHSAFDPETGATEFGRGSRGRAMEEYAGELQEIIDGLRAHGITGKDNAS